MSLTKRLCLFAGAALSLTAGAAAQVTLDQSRAYTSELVADASGRTSALARQGGDFTVNVHGYEQFRYNWNNREDDGLEDDSAVGFQNARTRLNFSGNVGNENWGYFIQFGVDDIESGGAFLEDAYITFKMGNGWQWKIGQFKLPGTREDLVGDQYQLFADRSVVNSTLSLGRGQGVQLSYEADNFRFYGAFSDGANTLNTDFTSMSEADWALTGRGEFKWAGNWRQFNDFTSFQNSDFAGMVGVAAHWQSGGDTFNTIDQDLWSLTADVSVEGNGWNAFAALIFANSDPGVGDDVQTWSFQIQGGVFVAPQWEIIAGYDVVIPDDDLPNDDNFNTLRLGSNFYFIPESHAAKVTVDLSWFLDTQGDSIVPASTRTGLLSSGDDSQWNLRGQVQLGF